MREAFVLDPEITFLNHGSFGACPRAVLAHQAHLRERLEAEPVRFFMREFEDGVQRSREALGAFTGARPDDLVFVTNATEGVNAVVRSLDFAPGDELIVTNHAYNACANAVRYAAERAGAKVVVAEVPFPITGPQQVVDTVLAAVTPRTRLALLDWVTSPSGIIFPLAELVKALEAKGVATLVDAAHAPGMVEVDLTALGAAFTTGNLHKWVCAPKGVGFLHVREDWQAKVRPVSISHGANASTAGRSRFLLEFDWTGTFDPTAWLSVPKALEVVATLHPDGWPGVRRANHALALEGRDLLLAALGTKAPAPDEMLGSLAAVVLPEGPVGAGALPGAAELDPVQERLFHEHRIEVPVFTLAGQRLLRISAQRYNRREDYEKLARALPKVL